MQNDPTVPYGYCHCGCGGKTTIAQETSRRDGYRKGDPRRYLKGHDKRRKGLAGLWRVRDLGYETPCWEWARSLSTKGYGVISLDGKSSIAHRRIYEHYVGPVPRGLTLDHLCRNRNCVNPAHLEPVTAAENTRRGSVSKLSMEKAEDIRREYASGSITQDQLAAKYGVSQMLIHRVVKGKAWI